MKLTEDLAKSLINSSEKFPIDFDDAWTWCGYTRKENALKKLLKHFQEKCDYEVFHDRVLNSKGQGFQGGRPGISIFISIECFKSFAMMAGTAKGREVRNYFLECEKIAKEVGRVVSSKQSDEELMLVNRRALELELIKAKQHYQDSGQAILATTSLEMLTYLRGDGPVPTKIEYRDRFVDSKSGFEINSTKGRSLMQLVADVGLNPKSTKDRKLVKQILAVNGWNYDTKKGWANASYLREYLVLPDSDYQKAISVVLNELNSHHQQNLFVNQFEQNCLTSNKSNTLPEK